MKPHYRTKTPNCPACGQLDVDVLARISKGATVAIGGVVCVHCKAKFTYLMQQGDFITSYKQPRAAHDDRATKNVDSKPYINNGEKQ